MKTILYLRPKKKIKLLLLVKIAMHKHVESIQIITMMVHQLCLRQKTLQVIKTTGVHQLLMVGVLRVPVLVLVPEQVVLKQMTGMHPMQPTLVLQLTGDL
jgi:hypothetical protein